jgi:choline monooxygenase
MSANLESPVQILKRVDRPIASATGLPNEQYTTPASFIQDRDEVIAPAWAGMAFVDELPEPGYVLPVDFMGLPLLAVRDKAGAVRVFHNVCSHRGTKLAHNACKTAGSIRCPYHSWTYALDGELIGTPHIGGHGIHEHPQFDKTLHGLREVRSHCWLGTVFINLSGNAPPFEEATAPIRQSWTQYLSDETYENLSALPSAGAMHVDVNSNWKLAVENYLEAYHLPTIHPELNRISPLRNHEYLESFADGAGQRSLSYHSAQVNGAKLPTISEWPEDKAVVSEYPVFYPNTFLGIHADHLYILILRPLSHDKTAEDARLFYPVQETDAAATQPVRDAILAGWTAVFQEDVDAVESCQIGRASPAYGGGAFSPVMDEPTLHFHQWVARKLAANGGEY